MFLCFSSLSNIYSYQCVIYMLSYIYIYIYICSFKLNFILLFLIYTNLIQFCFFLLLRLHFNLFESNVVDAFFILIDTLILINKQANHNLHLSYIFFLCKTIKGNTATLLCYLQFLLFLLLYA